MKKYLICICLTAIVPFGAMAQISHGGHPYFSEESDGGNLVFETLNRPDIDALRTEDETLDQYASIPYRFGANLEVDFGLDNSGVWTDLPNGGRVWRLAVQGVGATSLNFRFDEFRVPADARVFVYTPDFQKVLGAFTEENNNESNALGVGLVAGDRMIIEYYEPAKARGKGRLHIDQVTYGYRDIFGGLSDGSKGAFGNSGSCNINVNCPEGAPYTIQKESVALIVANGNAVCSGALVNNTAQDGTPYFLTANHCLPGNPDNVSNWVFYFNYEAPSCVGDDGPTNQSVSGATFLARNAYSDFALLELNTPPPSSYNACLSGWDATDAEATVLNAYGIHHPSGDVKKICFEDDAPYHDAVSWIDAVWFIDQWELGVTEGGSSGSPLFNQNGLIIGQLGGGSAACQGSGNNGGFDYFGRFGVSWSHGNLPANALRFWLDPGNTGILTMPNSCGGALPNNDLSVAGLTGLGETLCSIDPLTPSAQVVNTGSNAISDFELSVTANGGLAESVAWSGNLLAGESLFVPLTEFTPLDGPNQVFVEVIGVNGGNDANPAGNDYTANFTAFENSEDVEIHIVFDDYSQETGWNIADSEGNVLYSVASYESDLVEANETVCLGNGCYLFTITDSWGDGMCCNFGNGSYTVVSENGDTLASGGDFDDFESTEICPVLDTQQVAGGNFLLFPNPSSGSFEIRSGTKTSHIHGVKVFDVRGRLLYDQRVDAPSAKLELPGTKAGVYVVEVEFENGYARQKLVLE